MRRSAPSCWSATTKGDEMANCGECLMEAVEVVDLDADGTCPRCGGNYSKGVMGTQPIEPGPDPSISDEVLCCPDCDRPNQFGQVCDSCERDRQEEIEAASA